jgi:hypothetical protein
LVLLARRPCESPGHAHISNAAIRPIEQAFAKLKTALRKAAERTRDAL